MPTLSWTLPNGHRTIEIEKELRIGRGTQNDIQLIDRTISTEHARFFNHDGTWYMEDLGSTNGSFVNGRRQQRMALKHNDVITLGDIVLTFQARPDGEHTTPSARPAHHVSSSRIHRSSDEIRSILHDNPPATRANSVISMTAPHAGPLAADDPALLQRRLKATYDISQATAATLDLSQILDNVLSGIFAIIETAERAFILLVDPETRDITTAAVKHRGALDDGPAAAISRTVIEEAMARREAILCLDAMADGRYALAESILDLGIRSMMVAPLVFQNEVLGAIHVDTRTAVGRFTEADLQLLSASAAQVAACVANAQLHHKLIASERLAAVGETVAGLTHCIGNIVQGIRGGTFAIDKALEDENLELLRKGWTTVKRNNAFMEEMVYDLLSYSKKRAPEKETTDLNTLAEEACDLSQTRARERQVAVTFNPAPQPVAADIDPKSIRRCLLNLLVNAVDACARNQGAVILQTLAPDDDGMARLVVRDTGSGISKETQARIFTMFYSTKGSKGTGLGLPITRKIIEEHGGRLDLESEEGRGTTFTVCLPSSPPCAGNTRRATAPPSPSRP